MDSSSQHAARQQQSGAVPPPPGQKPIGELMVDEGFITRQQLDAALAEHQREQEHSRMPLGQILVEMGALSQADLDAALSHPNLRKNLGSFAVERGLITRDDLKMVLAQKKPGQLIGEVMVAYGLLTSDDVGRLLKEQIDSPKLGSVLIDLKLISETDLQEAIRRQKAVRPLGAVLCDMGLITANDLNYVLDKYGKQLGLAEILIKMGMLDELQLTDIKREQSVSAQPLATLLQRQKILTHEQIQQAFAFKYHIPYDPLTDFTYTQREKELLTSLISQKYAEKHLLLPLALIGEQQLRIAICSTEARSIDQDLKKLYPQLAVEIVLTTEPKFEELFEILYSKRLNDLAADDEGTATDDMDFMDIDLDESISDREAEPLVDQKDIEAEELVNFIVKYGILNNASDIHIEQDRKGPRIRYRIDGILQDMKVDWLNKKLPEKVGSIISRIKVMSSLDIAERRLPQDGVFRINYYDRTSNKKFDLDFRVATCRAIVGENLTVRILDSRKANVGLENLGHSLHVLEPLKRLLKSSAGMILLSGPTGSGKSSTLYGALQYVYNPGVKIITAEDPIEYSFPGIMQTQIQPKIGITFARLLRSFLRLDPDIVLVGEMRDQETAAIGFDAAQTGHLLLSTLHTNDAISAVSRLSDLQVDHAQIASCLLAVLAQRLVRKICPHCKKEYVPSEDEWGLLFDSYPAHLNFYVGEGCEQCNFTGYRGRTLLSEIFTVDRELAMALAQRASDRQLKKIAIESGMKTMLDDGLMKLQETTLREILRVIPHDMIKTFKMRKQNQGNVNNLIDNLFDGRGQTARQTLAPETFEIADPTTQPDVVAAAFAKYATLATLVGNGTSSGDEVLFGRYLAENHQRLLQQFNSRAIAYTIEEHDGRVRIRASQAP